MMVVSCVYSSVVSLLGLSMLEVAWVLDFDGCTAGTEEHRLFWLYFTPAGGAQKAGTFSR